jgi:hypothetical protein
VRFSCGSCTAAQATFVTFPERMHCVHTRSFRTRPETRARTDFRFGRKRRRDLLFAWLTVFPVDGFLPQISHEKPWVGPL